jgi:hypothetical protein
VELFQKLEQRLEVTLANQQSKGNMGIKAANLFVRVGECEKCRGALLRHSTKTKVRRRQWMKTEHGDFATMEELAWTLNINTAYRWRDEHRFQWEYIHPPQREDYLPMLSCRNAEPKKMSAITISIFATMSPRSWCSNFCGSLIKVRSVNSGCRSHSTRRRWTNSKPTRNGWRIAPRL